MNGKMEMQSLRIRGSSHTESSLVRLKRLGGAIPHMFPMQSALTVAFLKATRTSPVEGAGKNWVSISRLVLGGIQSAEIRFVLRELDRSLLTAWRIREASSFGTLMVKGLSGFTFIVPTSPVMRFLHGPGIFQRRTKPVFRMMDLGRCAHTKFQRLSQRTQGSGEGRFFQKTRRILALGF